MGTLVLLIIVGGPCVLIVLTFIAAACKLVRIIFNTPVTWSGREYRRSK